MTRESRWGGALAGTLALTVLALLTATPFLLAAAAVPLAYVLVGALSRVSPDAALRAERSVAAVDPAPGDRVPVTLTVENVGDATLTDVRVVDGVPEELAVVTGSPRICTSLRPGETATAGYQLVAKRGTFAFEPPAARVRPLAATDRAGGRLAVTGNDDLVCANVVNEVPLSDATLPRAGTRPTDSGGSGVEFHATRQYRPGDPVKRIDWRRYAKTGALTTVEYREEQAVRTVLVVDARPVARVTPEPGYPTGAELSAYAAERLFDALRRTSVLASVCAVGLAPEHVNGGLDPDGLAWAGSDGDGHLAARVARVFDGVGTAARAEAVAADRQHSAGRAPGQGGRGGPRPAAADGGGEPGATGSRGGRAGHAGHASATNAGQASGTNAGHASAATGTQSAAAGPQATVDAWTARVLARLPPTAQVVAFTPLLDEWGVTLARSLSARGYPTTVVSPDVTGATLGGEVVSIERDQRLGRIELTGAGVIDWDRDEPIDAALRASMVEVFDA